jgi:hypothetical protein
MTLSTGNGSQHLVHCLKFAACFGTKLIHSNQFPTGIDPKHLLWALYFLTVYDTEHNSSHSLGKVGKKTYKSCQNYLWMHYHTLNVKW